MVNRKSRNAYFITHGSPRKRMGLYCKSRVENNPVKEVKRKKKNGIVITLNETKGHKKIINNHPNKNKSKKRKNWKLIAVTWKDAKEYFENLEKKNSERLRISA